MSMLRRRMMMAVKKPNGNLPDYSSYRGVYIEDVDGFLYTEAEWDGSKTPNGIAVLTDNCRFVMALQNVHTSYCQWGSYGTEVTGVLTTTDKSTAKTDYRGNENTTAILNQLGNSSSTSDTPAAYYCRAFTFPNGKKGYLGSAGEWQAALNNKNAIVSALSKCGGTAMSDYYWTSTQYSSSDSWCMIWRSERLDYNLKSYVNFVRAFAALKSDGQESGGKIENKASLSEGTASWVLMFDYPVNSSLTIHFTDGTLYMLAGTKDIDTGYPTFDKPTIESIEPSSDDMYNYTF